MPDSRADEDFWDSLPAITEPEVRAFFERLQPERDAAVREVARASSGRTFPGERWGHLELREVLGRGASGVVYRALDPKLDREVALKLMPVPTTGDEQLPRFYREARELARVHHPNVLLVHGVDLASGWIGMWTEFIRGVTLEQVLTQRGRVEPEECIAIGLDLCGAADAVHDAGLVHGDIKCENVMREWGGRLVLVDFGLTGIRGVGIGSTAARGTPLYMAPERFRGAPPTPASDIYAIGVALYRLLTGEYPVPARSIGELFTAHERGVPVALPGEVALLSETLAAAVLRALAPDPEERWRRAGDLARGLRSARPELRAGRAARPDTRTRVHGLPEWLTPFVGREEELEQIRRALDRGRLVTITGAVGSGKSRIAREALGRQLDAARRGERRPLLAIWWVPLAPVQEDGDVVPAIAAALGVSETPGHSTLDAIAERIGSSECVLVLDDCERVLEGTAGAATALLGRCAELRVLTTSREVLGLPGECVRRLRPLHLPPGPAPGVIGSEESLARLSRVESVRLFLECARLADPEFSLNADTADPVARICRALDGIPLAIELVAAGLRGRSIQETLDRVNERLLAVSTAVRGGLPHHRTLQAAVEWSHSTLDPRERSLFRRLSIFAGGWTHDAAIAVCASERCDRLDALDLLSRLIDTSLVEVDLSFAGAPDRRRYSMLGPIREFARTELERAGEHAQIESAHRRHFTTLGRDLAGRGAFAHIEADHANLLAALRSYARPDADLREGLKLAAALGAFWLARGHWSEGREIGGRLLADPRGSGGSPERASLLAEMGCLAFRQGDPTAARNLAEEGLASARSLADEEGITRAATVLGVVLGHQGERQTAAALHAEALASARKHCDSGGVARVLAEMGALAADTGDAERARALFEEALAQIPKGSRTVARALLLNNLGGLAIRSGDLDRGRDLLEESLEVCRVLGLRDLLAASLGNLGNVASASGDLPTARSRYEESLEICRELGDRQRAARLLYNLGTVGYREGDRRRARRLLEEARAELCDLGVEEQILVEVLLGLGDLAQADGDLRGSEGLLRESLSLSWKLGDWANVLSAVALLASLTERGGDPRRAARLLGALAAVERDTVFSLSTEERAGAMATQARIVSSLGEESFALEHASGVRLDREGAVRSALDPSP